MTVFDDWFEQVGTPSLFDHFSESVTFTPVDGSSPKKIRAVVLRLQRREVSDNTQDNIEEWKVEILKDDQDAVNGGVSYLKVGDRVKRELSVEVDGRELVFTGELIDESNFSAIGVFSRKVRVAQGRGR